MGDYPSAFAMRRGRNCVGPTVKQIQSYCPTPRNENRNAAIFLL